MPFMGGEFGRGGEWGHEESLDWHLLGQPLHAGLLKWVVHLNALYRDEPAMYELDFDPAGFEWIDANDSEQSTVSFLRRGRSTADLLLVVCNFTPVPRHHFRVGTPRGGWWQEALDSDSLIYGGRRLGHLGGVEAESVPTHGRPYSLRLTLPPLSVLYFKNGGTGELLGPALVGVLVLRVPTP